MRDFSPLWHLTLNRFREFFREPAAVFWVYGFPLILALLLGSAFRNRPVERIRVDVVADGPGGVVAAKAMLDALRHDERLTAVVAHAEECRNRMRTAKTDLVVTPPASPGGALDYLVEPNRPEAVLARNAVDNVLLRSQLPAAALPREQTIDAIGGRYIDFLIPGLIGTNLMGGGLWGVGFVIVNMRVRKLLKRYLATPMRKTDFLLSLVISRTVFTFIEIAILWSFAWLIFDVRVFGNLLALFALMLAGSVCFGGIGLLVACRATTMETVSGLMNAIMLPMYLLSGVFFSADRFPDGIQPFIQALPLTVLIDGVRSVMNDGAGFEVAWKPILILLAWGVVCFGLALRLFRWR
ncbi:ABC transporter permease [Limnoglobus roseus]|uniref:ABC transporter permease n=1 Tax=Limnoglobus roseus TaxID=2598579 RepID=A0A5C1AD08_9BACT|nr:ABC transporter permease [Limnoglobus roseus]QEL16525.1 ABC transporter permease [Limnoglobus roseus]